MKSWCMGVDDTSTCWGPIRWDTVSSAQRFCHYPTSTTNVLTCGSRWYHRLLKCDPVRYSQYHQYHHLRDLPLVSHWCDDRFDMRKSLVLPLAESWSRETLRFHLRDSFASHWYEGSSDEMMSLILQLAVSWPSEIPGLGTSDPVSISLICGLFRQTKLADISTC